jgi:DNA modification methylase
MAQAEKGYCVCGLSEEEMTYKRKEIIGDCTLYLGDCLEVMPMLGKVDAVVTDPPYGISEAAGKNASRVNMAMAKDYGFDNWDDKPCSLEQIEAMKSCSNWQIIFGGNYFHLPPTSCWLVWDKLNGASDFADCELAWTNLDKAVRRIQFRWNGMIRQNGEARGDHPTQKPIEVMRWCIGHLPQDSETILDPFMGSGTTGVACAKLGRKFIGIELEEKYFDIACKRISDAYKQPDFFIEPPQKKLAQDKLDF